MAIRYLLLVMWNMRMSAENKPIRISIGVPTYPSGITDVMFCICIKIIHDDVLKYFNKILKENQAARVQLHQTNLQNKIYIYFLPTSCLLTCYLLFSISITRLTFNTTSFTYELTMVLCLL